MIYLYHLDSPLGSARKQAQHYLGYCADFAARDALHRSGRGARMLACAVERGIGFQVVRTWAGDRALERRLKNRKAAGLLCPVCAGTRAWDRARFAPVDDAWDFPAPTMTRADGYEYFMLACWRKSRPAAEPGNLDLFDTEAPHV
jgi:hypothetical protein